MTLTAANALSGIDINIDSPWTKISDNVAFQQNTNINSADKKGIDNAAEEAIHRFLGSQKTGQTTDFGVSPYENGMLSTGTEWNSYQLAWRLLGYYVDCNQNGNKKNRNLKDDGGGGDACTRYVMYAVVSGRISPYLLSILLFTFLFVLTPFFQNMLTSTHSCSFVLLDSMLIHTTREVVLVNTLTTREKPMNFNVTKADHAEQKWIAICLIHIGNY